MLDLGELCFGQRYTCQTEVKDLLEEDGWDRSKQGLIEHQEILTPCTVDYHFGGDDVCIRIRLGIDI